MYVDWWGKLKAQDVAALKSQPLVKFDAKLI